MELFFFNIFRIDILKFQKIPKIILDVDIYVLHSPANFQSEIVCTLTYTKMTNSVRSENLTLFTDSDQEICHFYTAQNTKYFALVFLHAGRTDNCLQLYYFAEFFET